MTDRDLLFEISAKVGVIHGVCQGHGDRLGKIETALERVEASCEMHRASTNENGRCIAGLQQDTATRSRRISEICRRLDVSEQTGEHIVATAATTWHVVKTIGAIVLGMAAIAGAVAATWGAM